MNWRFTDYNSSTMCRADDADRKKIEYVCDSVDALDAKTKPNNIFLELFLLCFEFSFQIHKRYALVTMQRNMRRRYTNETISM